MSQSGSHLSPKSGGTEQVSLKNGCLTRCTASPEKCICRTLPTSEKQGCVGMLVRALEGWAWETCMDFFPLKVGLLIAQVGFDLCVVEDPLAPLPEWWGYWCAPPSPILWSVRDWTQAFGPAR